MGIHAAWRLAFAAVLAHFALGFATPVLAQSNTSAVVPHSAKALARESMRLPPTAGRTVLRLEDIDPAAITAVRHANAMSHTKRLQIGIGRAVDGLPGAQSMSLGWVAVPGGAAAQWEVTSRGASALRVGLVAARMAPGVELRFAGRAAATVYGPFAATDVKPGELTYWSPVLEGDTATIEVFVPDAGTINDASLAITQISHLFVSPSAPDMERLAKAAQFCEVDLVCRAAGNAALAQTGRAVARMTFSDGLGGGTSVCTGTLLNPVGGGVSTYFYSANHCISTQASASTLTTHWFYEASSCGAATLSASYVQVAGGATLLYNSRSSDALLLRLNNSPPPGASLAGWDASSLTAGTSMTAIHHPAGDVKKVSLGTFDSFGTSSLASGSFLRIRWNSAATGVTEGGSSGSGIFSDGGGSDYRFRGGLLGGPSSCTAAASLLYDDYSRLDQVYPFIAQYLNPGSSSCSYSLSPASASLGAGGGSGSFTVTASGACAWTASSNASWLTANGSGSGSGSVTFSATANPDTSGRTGTISVGGQAFTVAQAGQPASAGGSNAVANPGFESGSTSWTQSGQTGEIITNNAAAAHSGNWYAWLGGYNNGTDVLYQDVAIPSGSGAARLQFWYLIGTQERSTSTAYDTMTVSIVSPSSGATLATLVRFSNLDATSGWVQSQAYDVSAFKGQTVRLQLRATTDSSGLTSFRLDDLTLSVESSGTSANYTALWWNPAESGWGLNVNQQGDILFGTIFTYDGAGNPMWLVMSGGARQGGANTFSGDLYRTTGPAFNAVPFMPIGAANVTRVGSMTVSFSGTDAGTLVYDVNGVRVTKSIQKQVYGARAADCRSSTDTSRASATNYQDLWWNAAESGWGVNVTHQGDTLFATLFTYDTDGQGLWLVMSAGQRQADGSYLGDLYRTTGSAFNAVPFTPIGAGNVTRVGTMRFAFANGASGTVQYSVNGASVTKNITRQVFSSPVPSCAS